MKKFRLVLCICVFGVIFSSFSMAAEHPGVAAEHPGKTAEHPGQENPKGQALLSAQEIIGGIKAHINEELDRNKGYYIIYDSKNKKYLKLLLIKVHENKVSYIKDKDAYFACTDFIMSNKMTTYDIDFWMKKTAKGLEVYDKKIHKKNGEPIFKYIDDEVVVLENAQDASRAPCHSPEAPSNLPEDSSF